MTHQLTRIQVIDSHTAGEPTRVVIAGGPALGNGSVAQRRLVFQRQFDSFRSAVVNEPRGSDVLVGALLCEPSDPACVAGVIFFNNVGCLNMCGHGTIGLAVTLAHLGRIGPGKHFVETPVGVVSFTYDGGNRVELVNVPSYRLAKDVAVQVEGIGPVSGDVAWGGNWFFLVPVDRLPGLQLDLAHVDRLTDFAWRTQTGAGPARNYRRKRSGNRPHRAVWPARTSGCRRPQFRPLSRQGVRSFPLRHRHQRQAGLSLRRRQTAPGDVWRQESIIGSVFAGSIQVQGDKVIPTITGSAYVCAEATLLFDPNDPLQMGIRASECQS